jgi:hypothetical protein
MLYGTIQHCRICGAPHTPWDDSGACEDCQDHAERCRCGALLTAAEAEKRQGCCDACLSECDICGQRLPWWQLDECWAGTVACNACAEEGL